MAQNILTLTLFWPAAGAVLLLFFPKVQSKAIAWFTTAWLLVGFLISLPLWFWWDSTASNADGFKFVVQTAWIPAINVQYYLGVDGISMLMILLTTLLGFIGAWCSWSAIKDRTKEFIFSKNLSEAKKGDRDIAMNWAFNKFYHLIGRITLEGPDESLKQELDELRRKFDIQSPYDF